MNCQLPTFMEIPELYNIYLKHPVVTTDSRNCPPNSIFFALKGDRFNGNLFAENALEKGCAYAVVDEWDKPENSRIIVVENVLEALQKLANYHRKKLKITIVGITGTNGKTTTKELIATILSKEFNVAFTQGNFNNHIGVPLTLLSINKSHEIGVIEMGANHPGEIRELCNIAEPNIGLITNIGKAHIEGFGSLENVIKTKCELYDFIREHEGKVFVNKDNVTLNEMSEGMDRTLYGRDNPDLFVSGTLSAETPFLHFDWNFFEHPYRVKTHLVGEYNLDNALAAAAIGKYFGINAEYISDALEAYEPKNNRSQFERTQRNDLIIDAYNANPTSMKVMLDFFAKISTDLPKAVILGEMKELGSIAEEEHRKMLDYLSEQTFDKVYLVGNIFQKAQELTYAYIFETVDQLNEELKQNPMVGYYVLLKGSHSVSLEKAIPFL
ncbi:MAG: UDP-N-acetylmuramoyl-tripeptide--D-alanyl-D-alanine ligase [Bacteroidetes bacterium ADurb.BinA174]|nr:MAG: UDP-N-acetylmuramoyl-tripeptide--D-alanyl-D-alanine ligase [Bacteroidetes bacterium ADurb.BinA174]